ncbi:PREDICTED: uncharacterized protein LOC105450104 [Wasmannia auropunctata]|uniref:uncharacterized protein LOC105450104 n=1 Tax=Wasmannia auropunctata TaxID=64793 RepID=UPI0005EDD707|nr:PREDICTED: uncharacterized protein LOC105450104 [Wasmannia auropunctata]XP_011688064.1 PREDICTED: uncharacterized protein LOC105450104 [Wasmannia auropunctata]
MADVSNFDEEFKSERTVRKRRSSIFQTRAVVHNRDEDDNEVITNDRLTSNKDEGECNAKDEAFNLKEYIERLRQERRDWQQEYRSRKTQRRNLTKQKASAEGQGQVLDINVLTEAERAFVLTRPNYEHICRNSQKLLDVALRISTLSQHVHKLNRRFMEKMEDNISRATVNVIKRSL